MTIHSKFSPSKRFRWALCPGSIREEALLPPEEPGSAAIDGTHTHALLECCVRSELLDPRQLIGQILSYQFGSFIVDEERAKRVKIAIDYLHIKTSFMGADCLIECEKKVSLKNLLGRNDVFGTVDIAISNEKILEIIDYKDGSQQVSAIGNKQLEMYALAYIDECGKEFEKIQLTIIQPKNLIKGLPAIDSWTITADELFFKRADLIAEISAADDPAAPLIPGDVQCKYCPVKSCSARANKAMSAIGLNMSSEIEFAQQAARKEPASMSDDELKTIMEAAPLIKQMIEGVEQESFNRLKAGKSIPGLKLVEGRGFRDWIADESEMIEKLKKMGVPKDSLYVKKFVSPAQVEKLTWEKKDGTKESLSPRQLKLLNEQFIVKSAGKLTVVLDNDPRQSIITDVTQMFSDISLPTWLK